MGTLDYFLNEGLLTKVGKEKIIKSNKELKFKNSGEFSVPDGWHVLVTVLIDNGIEPSDQIKEWLDRMGLMLPDGTIDIDYARKNI